MSIWIRSLCTKNLEPLEVEDLRHAIDGADFFMMAESQGLEDEVGEAAENALRFEGPSGELAHAKMYYRPKNPGGSFISVDRRRGVEARGEAQEMLPNVEDRMGPVGKRIRDLLGQTVEIVAFCLKQSDVDGMGWPISWHIAMSLARKGKGLVESNGEWWDPETYKAI
jgi:hypothetical protein